MSKNNPYYESWLFMSLFKKIILSFSTIILLLIAYTYFSPKPAAFIIKQLFKEGVAVKPEDYNQIKAKTTSYNDINYVSKYADGIVDIVVPKEQSTALPTIIWVHGGAYVGGDKKDVTEYAVQLAAKGYAVVNMNYALAPGSNYPTPLKQMDEVYAYLVKNAKKYNVDLQQLFIAGDSAGAQIASQYINVQVDPTYAKKVNLSSTIPANSIRGALLFCGPYDLASLDSMSSNKILGFFLERAGWAYIGQKDWKNAEATQLASLTDQVSKQYVPTFITDGNSGSFESHAKKLSSILSSYSIPVTEVFYPLGEAKLGHEYQFMMDLPQSQQTFDELITFLATQTK